MEGRNIMAEAKISPQRSGNKKTEGGRRLKISRLSINQEQAATERLSALAI